MVMMQLRIQIYSIITTQINLIKTKAINFKIEQFKKKEINAELNPKNNPKLTLTHALNSSESELFNQKPDSNKH